MDNTQLPAEIENKIFNVLLNHSLANRTSAAKELAELFATEYATKLNQADRVVTAYKKDHKTNSDLLDKAIDLIEKMHERCKWLYHDELYNEIKTFLDEAK